MNRLGSIFPRFLSGLIEVQDALLIDSYIGKILKPFPHTTSQIGTLDAPFANVFADNISNQWGQIGVNSISSDPPLYTSITNGLAEIQLSIDDNSLSIVDGMLSVKSIVSIGSTGDVQFDAPLYITAP